VTKIKSSLSLSLSLSLSEHSKCNKIDSKFPNTQADVDGLGWICHVKTTSKQKRAFNYGEDMYRRINSSLLSRVFIGPKHMFYNNRTPYETQFLCESQFTF
jgi:hypothetical protein